MRANKSELSYNSTWIRIQFKYYQIDFSSMKGIMNDLQNGNHSPLPFTDIDEQKCWFQEHKSGRRVVGCVKLLIEHTPEQLKQLRKHLPDKETESV